jgi:hypothetical protein
LENAELPMLIAPSLRTAKRPDPPTWYSTSFEAVALAVSV